MFKKRVFIIGNGFDISLGRRTKFSDFAYSDFAVAEFWNKISMNDGLGLYLSKKKETEKWYDLEEYLRKYAVKDEDCANLGVKDYNPVKDKEVFDKLVSSLSQYLIDQQINVLENSNSPAFLVSALINELIYDCIYSFNYTSYSPIKKKCMHVHGDLLTNTAILGIDEKLVNIQKGYEFLYKVFNENYKHSNIQQDLLNASEVVIFGHSLAKNDYHFFESFFKERCKVTNGNLPRITILCYDEASRISILKNIDIMTGGKTDSLFDNNDLNIIKTDNVNNTSLLNFYSRLQKDKETRQKTIDKLNQLTSRF